MISSNAHQKIGNRISRTSAVDISARSKNLPRFTAANHAPPGKAKREWKDHRTDATAQASAGNSVKNHRNTGRFGDKALPRSP